MSLFISMEGPDGSGKTLQMDLLEKALREAGYDLIRSREPGGTPIGEKIRDVILDPCNKAMDPVTEAYLYASSRSQHVKEKILPALQEGKIVLLDRFLDSSLVYQGIARGLGIEFIENINSFAVTDEKTGRKIMPDVTLMVYIDYEEGLRRKKQQEGHELDRMEQERSDFHRMVNEGYLTLAHRYPERIRLIDGVGSIEEVHERVMAAVRPYLETL